MVGIPYSRIVHAKKLLKDLRKISIYYVQRNTSSKAIRKRFLEYFVEENGHNLVKSSPVVPFCDPTVAFVNAGMNQFKGIFLGNQTPQYRRVANSQKCVRVGGKHNDLNVVGTDGYHHTFFEMLGNWSFGDYYKEDACLMAWDLLTNVYKLPPKRLYVTYFKGDETLGIPEDLETREIWRQIGVSENRIIPFGLKDNFWEMGPTGPCGPCTEIHIDRRSTSNRSAFVNKGLHDLTEIWNLVFIEYNRNLDGSIQTLPQKHVDTGMGFERLTAILQGRISNYDTDNFSYLIKAIHKNCSTVGKYEGKFGENDWNSLDTHYRTLADHARMITICLGDGVIPEENQKLRRILRKSFLLSEIVFKRENGLIKELSNYVIENLGPIYNELEKNAKQIHQIIDYEEEIFKSIRQTAASEWSKIVKENSKLNDIDVTETPSIVQAYKEIISHKTDTISSDLAFKLYDTFGLDEEDIHKLSKALNLKFSSEDLLSELEKAKQKSKEQHTISSNDIFNTLIQENITKTDDSYKYQYSKAGDEYKFENIEVKVLKIIENDQFVDKIKRDNYCLLLLDKTNLYSEAGGQTSDKGEIHFDEDIFNVIGTHNLNGYVLHSGFLNSTKNALKPDSTGILYVDRSTRLNNMRNHTSTHLLNASLKKLKGATCQKSSKVTDLFLNLDVAIFGNKLTMNEIIQIEDEINHLILSKHPVLVRLVNSQELLNFDNVTMIPGETYPETDIRLVEMIGKNDFVSREPCCGTHVFNTADIEDFCIITVKSLGRSTTSLFAVTGERAKTARNNAKELTEEIAELQKRLNDNIDKPDMLDLAVMALRNKLNYSVHDSLILPVYVKHSCSEKLELLSKHIKESARGAFKDIIEMEMQNVLQSNLGKSRSNKNYIVHYLRSSMVLESVPLQRATKICPDLPILVISYADNMVKARCCVPKDLTSKNFNAEKWMKETVAAVFKSRAAPPKGQDGSLVCNMKTKRVHMQEWDTLLNESMELAKKYVDENL